MYKINLYRFKDDDNKTIISVYEPECEYELMYRLIPQSEDFLITDYIRFTDAIDIPVIELPLWHEVHKDDLNTPVPQIEDIKNEIDILRTIEDEQDSMIIDLATELAILQLTM